MYKPPNGALLLSSHQLFRWHRSTETQGAERTKKNGGQDPAFMTPTGSTPLPDIPPLGFLHPKMLNYSTLCWVLQWHAHA